MAEANTSQAAFIEESTWAVTPASPELTEIRLTAADFQHAKATIESAELRSDRMTADLVQVGASAQGGFPFEWSYLSHDPFLESAMFSAFVSIDETISSLAVSGQTITGAASDFDNLLIGGFIKISGATTSGNNGFKRVIAKAGDGSSVTFAAGSLSGSDTGETMTFAADDLRNGVTEKSFTIEQRIPHNATDYFQVFRGMVVAQMNLTIADAQISTGNFAFVGSAGSPGSSTIDNAGGYTLANANPILSGNAGVGGVYMDDYSDSAPGATLATDCLKTVTFDINNNLRGLTKLGQVGAFDVGSGEMALSGSFEAYFQSNDLWTDFINHQYKSFAIEAADPAGNTYIITLPRINFADGNPPLTGKNTDVMQTMQWRAIRDTVSNAQMIVNKFAA